MSLGQYSLAVDVSSACLTARLYRVRKNEYGHFVELQIRSLSAFPGFFFPSLEEYHYGVQRCRRSLCTSAPSKIYSGFFVASPVLDQGAAARKLLQTALPALPPGLTATKNEYSSARVRTKPGYLSAPGRTTINTSRKATLPPHPPFNVSGVLVPVVGTEGRA